MSGPVNRRLKITPDILLYSNGTGSFPWHREKYRATSKRLKTMLTSARFPANHLQTSQQKRLQVSLNKSSYMMKKSPLSSLVIL